MFDGIEIGRVSCELLFLPSGGGVSHQSLIICTTAEFVAEGASTDAGCSGAGLTDAQPTQINRQQASRRKNPLFLMK
jgi:hypothetical protein